MLDVDTHVRNFAIATGKLRDRDLKSASKIKSTCSLLRHLCIRDRRISYYKVDVLPTLDQMLLQKASDRAVIVENSIELRS